MTHWYEGNSKAAKDGVEAAMQVLLEGKVTSPSPSSCRSSWPPSSLSVAASAQADADDSFEAGLGLDEVGGGVAAATARGAEEGESIVGGVPVPLVLCVVGALMFLITAGDKQHESDDDGDGVGDAENGNTRCVCYTQGAYCSFIFH